MARIPCPVPDFNGVDESGDPKYWIALPDKWLGDHAQRRDEAAAKGREAKLGETLLNFGSALSVLDDWSLPGFTGNPDNWDYTKIRLEIIAWVNQVTNRAYWGNYDIPKNS